MKPKIPMIVCSPDASWWYWTKKGCVSLDAITMREDPFFLPPSIQISKEPLWPCQNVLTWVLVKLPMRCYTPGLV